MSGRQRNAAIYSTLELLVCPQGFRDVMRLPLRKISVGNERDRSPGIEGCFDPKQTVRRFARMHGKRSLRRKGLAEQSGHNLNKSDCQARGMVADAGGRRICGGQREDVARARPEADLRA